MGNSHHSHRHQRVAKQKVVQTRPWLPTDLANLQLWLDGSKIIGIADGTDITAWADQSGKNNDFSQATAANKPHSAGGAKNGLTAARFDGVNHYMVAGDVELHDNSDGMTIFIVRQHSAAATKYMLSKFATGDRQWFIRSNSFSVQDAFDANNANTIAAITDSSNWEVLTCYWAAGGNPTVYIDGSLDDTAAAAVTDITDRANTLTLGGLSTPAASWDGDIGEILAFNKALSATDRALIENYLKVKWGI